jgi:cytoskeletal protein CcmA (bactofilin family)
MTNLAPSTDASVPARPPGRSVLSPDLRITGDIVAGGVLEVLGEIDGSITAKALILGSEGRIDGTIQAESVELRGRMKGTITTGSLALKSTANVEAEVTYSSLAIESGAQIEGSFARPKQG